MSTEQTRLEEMEKEVTDLRRKVADLEKSRLRYESLFESLPISIWLEDYTGVKKVLDEIRRSGVQDFKGYFEAHPEVVQRCAQAIQVLDINRATLVMYRAERKEQILAGLPIIFGEETFAAFRDQLTALASGKTSWECETVTLTLDGMKNRVLINVLIPEGHEATWERVFVTTLDITARAAAREAEMRASAQEELIRAQRVTLGSLSTPAIPISDDIIVMPLVGVLDSQRMAQVTDTLLGEVGRRRATTAIVDITGVAGVDSAVAGALIRLARAVRLLGAKVVLTGIRPEVAQVLVQLGVNFGDVVTHGTLQAGIAYATRR